MRKFPTPEELSSLPPDGGDQYNRLVFESSPYLRQHASNAVDWYPWTEEAFAKARAESKPIFLSVGYSTCHWCHVMEHESFADDVVAELMNRKFVPIKLDREERPDLDHQYMAVTQAMQGQGGWPNSLFLTPNAEPFFAFTYLPKDQFLGLLSQISDLWETQMEQVAGRALDISRIVGGSLQAIRGGGSLAGIVESTCKNLLQNADEVNGGFGHAPKFPHADDLVLLTRCGDGDADRCVGLTLTKMRHGGIYDQLAGGFHRYSTDEKWLLPHFEKMLYDQASLVNAYSEAYAKQGTKLFKDTAIETLDFVDKYLSHPDGSFLSAMDADSEGEEGKSYVWTEVEIESVLGTDADVAKQMFGTSPNGNFIEERSKEKTGANVLVLTVSPHAAQIAPTSPFGRGPSLERSESGRGEGNRLAIIREKLLAARNERIQPQIDDKVLTDWNGMLIAAMARAGVLLGEHFYVQRAGKAAEVLLERFCLEKKLTHQAGKETAFLDDYAFFILALIELHQADFDPAWLRKAKEYADLLIKDFEDNVNSGFHMTREPLPGTGARPKAAMDSAHRSGYAAATTALIRLGRILQNPNYIDVARKAIEAASGDVAAMSTGHTGLVVAYDELNGGVEAVVVSNGREESEAAIKVLRANYAPRAIFIPVYPGSEAAEFAASLPMIENKITYYICRNYTCEFPTTEIDEVRGGLS